MALGPGTYDHLTTYVREQAQAAAVVVIVIDGNKGSGFSAQAVPEVAPKLTTLLRLLADQMEDDTGQGTAAPTTRCLTGDLTIDGSDERIDMAGGTMRVAGGTTAPEAAPEPIKAPLHKAR